MAIFMKWKKMGFLFKPDASIDWMQSHAQTPTVLVLYDRFRIFFATRNNEGKSQIAVLDVDKANPQKIIALHKQPALSFGKPGTFDSDGVMPSSVLTNNNQLWMYYTGWNQRITVPYHNATGLAVSDDNGLSFHRLSDGPIMDRTYSEPYIAVTPYVIHEQGIWKMWYTSGIKWELVDSKYEPIYVIKYATSFNGIDWNRTPNLVIQQSYNNEVFSRPTILKKNNTYHLWFCYRGCCDYRDGKHAYQIGYAQSIDGINWIRRDADAGIYLSQDDWDSTMLCYPYVFSDELNHYMIYNGNGFGASGIGYALLITE